MVTYTIEAGSMSEALENLFKFYEAEKIIRDYYIYGLEVEYGINKPYYRNGEEDYDWIMYDKFQLNEADIKTAFDYDDLLSIIADLYDNY